MKRNLAIILLMGFYYSLTGQTYDVTGDYKISGRVGIGTALPSYKLDIGNSTEPGIINIINNNYGDWVLRKSRSDNSQIVGFKSFNDGEFGIYANDIECIRINSVGKIGIGTTSPIYKLDIGSSADPGMINITNNNYGDWVLRKSRSDATQVVGFKSFNGGGFGIYANNIEGIRINSVGRVGIGTTSPNYKLDIGSSADPGMINITNNNYGDWILRKSRSDNTQIVGFRSFEGGELGVFSNNSESIRVNSSGNVGIGTTDPGNYKLAVQGTIGAREVKVTLDSWSDFVFNSDYVLKELEEVENFIEENNHLPDIPSETEVVENGFNLGEMDAKLLQKIEELTLYMIEMNKRVNYLETENSELKERIVKMDILQ